MADTSTHGEIKSNGIIRISNSYPNFFLLSKPYCDAISRPIIRAPPPHLLKLETFIYELNPHWDRRRDRGICHRLPTVNTILKSVFLVSLLEYPQKSDTSPLPPRASPADDRSFCRIPTNCALSLVNTISPSPIPFTRGSCC